MELKRYFGLLTRWLWLLGLAFVLGGGAAYVISKNTPPTYRATTTLMVSQARASTNSPYNDILTNERMAKTFGELLQTADVLKQTAIQLGGVIYPDTYVNGQVNVELIRDTQLIQLSVDSTDPVRAVIIAQTIPVVFSQKYAEVTLSRYAPSKQALQEQMTVVQGELAQAQTMLSSLKNDLASPERARLEASVAQYRATYADLLKSYEGIRVAEAQEANTLIVANPPQLPTEPIGPRTMTNTVLAALVAGMFALAIVLLIEHLDDRVKSPDDLSATNLPTLGSIALIDGKTAPEKLVVTREPRSPISEAYRVLRTNLEYAAVGNKNLRRVVVTSASAGEGKSTTAANLAACLAQAGKRVVLVDADLRRPTQHKIFGLSNNEGLTTALLNVKGRSLSEFLQRTDLDTLVVLPSGPTPPNPAEMLNSAAMNVVLDELSKVADVVIIDCPPVLSVADASILANKADGIMLVLNWGITRRDAVLRTVETLQPAGTPLLGLVLNRMSNHSGGYYYYYYRSHYYTGEQKKHSRPKARWLTGLRQVIQR